MSSLSFSRVLALAAGLCLGATAAAQGCVALAPSGQPALAGIAPICRSTVGLAVVEVFGNPAFALHCPVVTPAVPAGLPTFLLIGVPVPPPIPLGPPLLDPAFGLPGMLAMNRILLMVPAGVSGTYGVPPVPLPIPAGLGPLGLALSAQIAVLTPAGTFGLTGATGIVI